MPLSRAVALGNRVNVAQLNRSTESGGHYKTLELAELRADISLMFGLYSFNQRMNVLSVAVTGALIARAAVGLQVLHLAGVCVARSTISSRGKVHQNADLRQLLGAVLMNPLNHRLVAYFDNADFGFVPFFICWFIYLFIYFCMFVWLFGWLFVCLFVCFLFISWFGLFYFFPFYCSNIRFPLHYMSFPTFPFPFVFTSTVNQY